MMPFLKLITRTLRLHQWVKNSLVFIPLLMAHQFSNRIFFLQTVWAFLSFSLLASAGYLMNDLHDLEQDKAHPKKCRRPLASGQISKGTAGILAAIFLMLGFLITLLLSKNFLLVSGFYFLMTLSYSFYFRKVVLIDVLCLAMLYALRIFAGAAATGIPVSSWLLAFVIFLFFSLALVKRCADFKLTENNRQAHDGRGYIMEDKEQLARLGTASGFTAVLVMALYLTSDEVTALYSRPALLWLICPVILYWVSRMWLLANRGVLQEDPIVFAIKDKISYVAGFAAILFLLLAI